MSQYADLDIIVATLLGYYVDKSSGEYVIRTPEGARFTEPSWDEGIAWAIFFARYNFNRWTRDVNKALALFGEQRLALLHDPVKGWAVYLGDFSDDIGAAMSVPDTRWSKTPAEAVVVAWLDWKGE